MSLTPEERQRIYEEEKAKREIAPRMASLAWVVIVLVVVSCAWLIAEPYFVLGRIQAAARKGDRDALEQCVDFPALREHLKSSMSAMLMRSMSQDLKDNPFAGLGMMLSGAMIDRVVDAYVTPDGLAMLSEGQRPDPGQSGDHHSSSRSPGKVRVSQGYRGMSLFHVRVWSGARGSDAITFVLHRRGIGWALADVRLPSLNSSTEDASLTVEKSLEKESAATSAPTPVRESILVTKDRVRVKVPVVPASERTSSNEATSELPIEAPRKLAASDDDLPEFGEYVYVENLPEAITKTPPIYPGRAREANVDGTVVVQTLVGRDGKVKDVRVVSTDNEMLNSAAVDAVKQWVFKPALSNGRPVATWIAVPVKFRLH